MSKKNTSQISGKLKVQRLLDQSEEEAAKTKASREELEQRIAALGESLAENQTELEAARAYGTQRDEQLASATAYGAQRDEKIVNLQRTYDAQITNLNQRNVKLEADLTASTEEADGLYNTLKVIEGFNGEDLPDEFNPNYLEGLPEQVRDLSVPNVVEDTFKAYEDKQSLDGFYERKMSKKSLQEPEKKKTKE